jgi:hypothetical protein
MKIDNTSDMTKYVKSISVEDRENVELFAVFPGFPKIEKITKVTNKHIYADHGKQFRYPSRDAGFVCYTSFTEAVRALDRVYHSTKEHIEKKYTNRLEQLQPLKWYLDDLLKQHPECFL